MTSSLTLEPDLDLAVAEESIRALLPASHAREAWIAEAALEYRRLRHLQTLGCTEPPERESLLSRFAALVPTSVEARNLRDPIVTYESVFGHSKPYPWTTPFDSLRKVSGLPHSLPGSGNA